MKRVARGILRRKWLVVFLFAVGVAVSFFASQQVAVNFRLADYLPDEANSTVGLRIMQEEFDTEPANLRILLEDVTVVEVLDYKEKIQKIEGIADVAWMDDSVNVRQPLEMIPQDILDSWYKEGNALITAYVGDEESEYVIGALRTLIGDRGSLSGDSVQTLETRTSVNSDIQKIMLLAVPIIFLILLISTNSYFEPVLFLATIGVAILIGKGTDLILGEVSFITNACSAILQLAISMDYAIFLLEAFGENKRAGMETFTAMVEAMVKASSSILSSSITTIMGFAVMVLMEFKVGYDMGIVLAKDIAISLICVLVLLPVLALIFSRQIDRTQHRSLMPRFERMGRVLSRICIPLLGIVALFVVGPSYLATERMNYVYGTTQMITDPAAAVVQAERRADELFDPINRMVLLFPRGDLAREQQMTDALETLDDVSSVLSYASVAGTTIPLDFVGEDAVSELIGANYDRILLTAHREIESERAYRLVEDVRAIGEAYYPGNFYLTGGTANIYDMRDTVRRDDQTVNGLALLTIGIVLLINFRSLSIPILLLLTIKSSIWINVGVPYFAGDSMYYISSLIINAIQLGATVDYGILFTERYMGFRKKMLRRDAVAATISSAAPAIITSSSILFAGGMTLGMISSVSVVEQLGLLVGRGALISAVMVLTGLPALLIVMDPLIRATTVRPGFMTKKKLRLSQQIEGEGNRNEKETAYQSSAKRILRRYPLSIREIRCAWCSSC